MKKQSQMKWVCLQLIMFGEVSRNKALKNYITRLGAYICELKKDGHNIVGGYVKRGKSKDYVYTLVK